MNKNLPADTQRYIHAMFSAELHRLKSEYDKLPFDDMGTQERTRTLRNISDLRKHYAAFIGPDTQLPITSDEALNHFDPEDSVLTQDDIFECAEMANRLIGQPATTHSDHTFTGKFKDVREYFVSFIDQTANTRVAEGEEADRDHYDAYGPND